MPIDWSNLPDQDDKSGIDWSGLPDNDAPVVPQQVQPEQPAEVPWYQRAWNSVNEPLTNAPSRFAQSVSNWIDPEDPIRGRSTGGVRGITSAFIEALGGIGDSATSPLSLGTAAVTGGASLAAKSGLPTAAKVLNTATRGAGAVTAGHGAMTVTDPNASWAERAGGLAELVGGGAAAKYGAPNQGRINPAIIPENIPQNMPDLPLGMMEEIPPTPMSAEAQAFSQPINPAIIPQATDDVDSLIGGLGLGNELDTVENLDPFQGRVNNASGTVGGGSAEEILRQQSMKNKGDSFVVYDRAGNERPIIGVEAQDYKVKPGETFGVKHADGSFTKYDDMGGKVSPISKTSDTGIPDSAMIAELPPDLRGAKPRFNMGQTEYVPQFANDVDKAMFILAQTKRSRRDADYLNYVMEQTGLDENTIRTAAIELRGELKNQLRGQPAGNVKLTQLYKQKGKTIDISPTTPEVPPTVKTGGSNKPPFEPPPPNDIPDPVPASKAAEPILIKLKEKEYPEAGMLRQAWNLSRGLMAVDLPFISSAGLRQGFRYVGTKDWFKAWAPSMKAYGSKKFYEAHKLMLESDPLMKRGVKPQLRADGLPAQNRAGQRIYKETESIAEQAGLQLTDLNSHSAREETIRSQLAEKIPVYGRHVAASNRSYTAYINDLRLNAFRNLYDAMPDKNNLVALKQIGDAVNAFTGRGKLAVHIPESTTVFGKKIKFRDEAKDFGVEKHASGLAEVLFSPRLMASRMQMLNPTNYVMMQPQVRKEYVKAAVRTAGAWLTMAKLAEMAGAEVVMDPTNTDFGKIKINGNTRIDPAAGFQQFIVLLTRLGTGEATASTSGNTRMLGEGYRPDTRGSMVQQFMVNKLHPSAKLFYDAMFASQGNPFRVGDRLSELAIPMISGDLMEIAQESPELLPMLAPLMSGGMGTQVYGSQSDYSKPGLAGQLMEGMGIPDLVIGGGE